MAGDWIALRLNLRDDPAVIGIAAATGLDEYAVVGRLHHLWSWANQHSANGDAQSVTKSWIDRHVSAPGFADAMVEVGWLVCGGTGLTFPGFERWNSKGAKRRLLTAKRMHESRSNCDAVSAQNVTHRASRERHQRREEKSIEEVDAIASTSSCPEPAEPASGQLAVTDPPVMTFPAVGTHGREWPLTASKLAEYGRSFPGVEVPAELLKARQWLLDNPTRRKTAGGMPKFLGGWLGRAQDRGGGRSPPGPRTKGEVMDGYAFDILHNTGDGTDDHRGKF